MIQKIIKGVGGKAFPGDYNWKCENGHLCRSFERECYTCRVEEEQKDYSVGIECK